MGAVDKGYGTTVSSIYDGSSCHEAQRKYCSRKTRSCGEKEHEHVPCSLLIF